MPRRPEYDRLDQLIHTLSAPQYAESLEEQNIVRLLTRLRSDPHSTNEQLLFVIKQLAERIQEKPVAAQSFWQFLKSVFIPKTRGNTYKLLVEFLNGLTYPKKSLNAEQLTFSFTKFPREQWRFLSSRQLPQVTGLYFAHVAVEDDLVFSRKDYFLLFLNFLRSLPNLEFLDLSSSKLGLLCEEFAGQLITALLEHPSLKEIVLRDNAIDDRSHIFQKLILNLIGSPKKLDLSVNFIEFAVQSDQEQYQKFLNYHSTELSCNAISNVQIPNSIARYVIESLLQGSYHITTNKGVLAIANYSNAFDKYSLFTEVMNKNGQLEIKKYCFEDSHELKEQRMTLSQFRTERQSFHTLRTCLLDPGELHEKIQAHKAHFHGIRDKEGLLAFFIEKNRQNRTFLTQQNTDTSPSRIFYQDVSQRQNTDPPPPVEELNQNPNAIIPTIAGPAEHEEVEVLKQDPNAITPTITGPAEHEEVEVLNQDPNAITPTIAGPAEHEEVEVLKQDPTVMERLGRIEERMDGLCEEVRELKAQIAVIRQPTVVQERLRNQQTHIDNNPPLRGFYNQLKDRLIAEQMMSLVRNTNKFVLNGNLVDAILSFAQDNVEALPVVGGLCAKLLIPIGMVVGRFNEEWRDRRTQRMIAVAAYPDVMEWVARELTRRYEAQILCLTLEDASALALTAVACIKQYIKTGFAASAERTSATYDAEGLSIEEHMLLAVCSHSFGKKDSNKIWGFPHHKVSKQYELRILPDHAEPDYRPNTLFVRIVGRKTLHYAVITPRFEKVIGEIEMTQLGRCPTNPEDLEALKQFLPNILTITSTKKHTETEWTHRGVFRGAGIQVEKSDGIHYYHSLSSQGDNPPNIRWEKYGFRLGTEEEIAPNHFLEIVPRAEQFPILQSMELQRLENDTVPTTNGAGLFFPPAEQNQQRRPAIQLGVN